MRIVHVGAIAAISMLALGACHRKSEQFPAQAPARQVPLGFSETTPDAKVKLTLGHRVGEQPGLRFKLYGDGVKELRVFVDQAHNDHLHLVQKGLPTPPYERDIGWTLTAATPRMLSVMGTWSDYTGGAHPNHGSTGLIWDIGRDHEVARTDLFQPGADEAKLDAVLCRAIKAAKAQRARAAAVGEESGTWSCPKWADSQFVFAPSTAAGKIGGLVFLFDPYVLGPYAEGDYRVTVPLSAFAESLSPSYAEEFAGAPAAAAPDR